VLKLLTSKGAEPEDRLMALAAAKGDLEAIQFLLVPIRDPVYQKGVQWLLQNQLADGSWFVPTIAVPVQPHTFESGFPHGWNQFASEAGSSWATLALLFTLPDKR